MKNYYLFLYKNEQIISVIEIQAVTKSSSTHSVPIRFVYVTKFTFEIELDHKI